MNAPSEDIKDMLIAESGLGLTFAQNLFISKEKTDPDQIVVIYDTFGGMPDLTMDQQIYERPSIQIKVRSRDYSQGYNLINEIYLSLHGRAHETWNGTIYELIRAINSPTHFDWDERGRARFIVNFNLQRKESADS